MIKNIVTNKHNKGGHYILTMLQKNTPTLQIHALMLHKHAHMLWITNSKCFFKVSIDKYKCGKSNV